MPQQTPSLLVLQEAPHFGKLGTIKRDRRSGRRLHDSAQVITPAEPTKPVLGHTCKGISRPVHRQSHNGRTNARDSQPLEQRSSWHPRCQCSVARWHKRRQRQPVAGATCKQLLPPLALQERVRLLIRLICTVIPRHYMWTQ